MGRDRRAVLDFAVAKLLARPDEAFPVREVTCHDPFCSEPGEHEGGEPIHRTHIDASGARQIGVPNEVIESEERVVRRCLRGEAAWCNASVTEVDGVKPPMLSPLITHALLCSVAAASRHARFGVFGLHLGHEPNFAKVIARERLAGSQQASLPASSVTSRSGARPSHSASTRQELVELAQQLSRRVMRMLKHCGLVQDRLQTTMSGNHHGIYAHSNEDDSCRFSNSRIER